MKQIFTFKSTLIALLVMFGCVMKAETVTYTIDGFTYNLYTETQEATLLRYGGDATEVVVPEFVTYEEKEYRVTWLRERCFYQCSSLVSIKLPSSVTGLGAYCFYGCSSLTSIKLPSSVIALGDYCFYSCYSLASIDFPESVEWLGTECFYGCSSLASIKIPSSVKSLSDYCFYGCSSLTSIEISASVTSLGKYCFAGCDSRESIVVNAGNPKYDSREGCNALIETESNTMILGGKNTRIPDSVTSLEEDCFSYCSSLTSIVIPASVTSLGTSGGNCFAGCSSLESIVVDAANPKYDSREGCNAIIETESNTMVAGCKNTIFPESVTSLGNGCFAYGSSPTSIVIPESVTSLGRFCFAGCYSLTSIKIPSSVTSFSDYCFSHCHSLTSIEIPSSVTSLGEGCFSGCSSLTLIEIPSSVTKLGKWCCFENCSSLKTVICKMETGIETANQFGGTPIEAATLYVPETMLDTYKATSPWSDFDIILPWTEEMELIDYTTDDGFSYILNTKTQEAFLDNYSGDATGVVVPASVAFGDNAYKVTRLGGDSFRGCSSITSIEIPESVTSLGGYCFQDCSSLMSIVIPESVTSLGDYCFQYCSSLMSIVIPASVTSVGEGSFIGCSSLESIVVDAANPRYDSREGCNAIIETESNTMIAGCKNTRILESVTGLGKSCFDGCSSLMSIEIPASVTSLGDYCFRGCSSLQIVTCKMEKGIKGTNSVFLKTPIKDATLFVSEEMIDTYQSTFPWSDFGTIQPLGVIYYTTDDGFAYSLYTDTQEATLKGYSGEATEVVVPEFITYEGKAYNVTNLKDQCFYNNRSITSIEILAPVTSLGSSCFKGCNSLTSIKIPESVTSLGGSCFFGCKSLTSIKIPASVTSLGWQCFYGCSALTTIEILAPVIEWGTGGFANCKSLKTVICKMETGIEGGSLFRITPVENATLYVPEKLLATYESTYPWSDFGTILPLFSLSDATLYLGEELQMSANVSPEYADNKTLDWTSSNPDVATVDANGNVTAIGIGETTITATITDGSGVSVSCHVTVLPVLAESLTVTPESWDGMEGDSFTLVATVFPENATDKSVSWSSSDSEIATVDAEGNVRVLKDGYCTIAASTQDGSNLSAECVITSVSGIDAIFKDANASFDIYDLQGILIKEGCHRGDLRKLPTGAYILRQGNVRKKIMIR